MSGVAAMALQQYNEVKLNASGIFANGSSGSPPRSLEKETWFYGTNQRYLLPPRALYYAIRRVYAKDLSSTDVKVYHITWNHKDAPHGFMVEYGTSRAAKHPFLRPAFDHIQDAIQAGLDRIGQRMSDGTRGLPT